MYGKTTDLPVRELKTSFCTAVIGGGEFQSVIVIFCIGQNNVYIFVPERFPFSIVQKELEKDGLPRAVQRAVGNQ